MRIRFEAPPADQEKVGIRDFLVGANLAMGEGTDTVGVWAKLVYGDDTRGIDLAEGQVYLRTVSSQENITQTVHWDGFIPLSGGSNRHLAAWTVNESGGARVFRLHAYRVREIGRVVA